MADTDGIYQSIRLLVDTGATYTPSAVISGLLGMDFLEAHQVLIDTGKAEIVIQM